MLPILITTDFSDVANNAVHFGCKMAQDLGTSVVVLHCYMIPITFNEDPMLVIPINEGQELAANRLKSFTENLKNEYPNLKIESEFIFGEVVDSIEDYASEHEIGLVVMGNSGEGATGLWLGSNVKSVLKHLKYFVLAIPANHGYKRPKQFCFACDFKNIANHQQLNGLKNIIKEIGGQLHVVNVADNNNNFSPEQMYEDSLVHQILSDVHPNYHLLNGKDVDETISEFVTKEGMDWLVISPHYHNIFERIFHKSHTTSMIQKSHVPLLAIHEK